MLKTKTLALALISALVAGPLMAQSPQPSTPTAPARPAPTAPATPAAPAAPAMTAPAAKPATATAKLIDINTATKDELDALPGIGAVRSEAIIKGRPYKGKDELVRKKIIPQNVYDKIKDQIIAKQA